MISKEYTGNSFFRDHEFHSFNNFNPDFLWEGQSFYEVLRVIDGKPLFLEDHLERFKNSVKNIRSVQIPDKKNFKDIITQLVTINNIRNGNIKIVLNFLNNKTSLYLYFITHSYPTPEDYKQGFKAETLQFERDRPEVKVVNRSLKEVSDAIIKEKKINEVILVDKHGNFTEGSKSNIFFIKQYEVYTPPVESVLPGITRKYVLAVCKNNHIPVHEVKIPLKSLSAFDAAFISGTSPKVMPLNRIDNTVFKPNNPLLALIIEGYDQLIIHKLKE